MITAPPDTIEYYQQLKAVALRGLEKGAECEEYKIGWRTVRRQGLAGLMDLVAWCDRQIARLQAKQSGRRGRIATIIPRDL